MSEVGKALDAAGEAARASLASDTTCPQAGGYVCTTPPCPCASDAASAAVAAFLHTMVATELHELAAAVEAAAKDADHG